MPEVTSKWFSCCARWRWRHGIFCKPDRKEGYLFCVCDIWSHCEAALWAPPQPPDAGAVAVGTVVSCGLTAVSQLLLGSASNSQEESSTPHTHTHTYTRPLQKKGSQLHKYTHTQTSRSGPQRPPFPICCDQIVFHVSAGGEEGKKEGRSQSPARTPLLFSVDQQLSGTQPDRGTTGGKRITWTKHAWKKFSFTPLLNLCFLFLPLPSQWEDWWHQWLSQEPFSDGEWPALKGCNVHLIVIVSYVMFHFHIATVRSSWQSPVFLCFLSTFLVLGAAVCKWSNTPIETFHKYVGFISLVKSPKKL